MGDWAHNWLGLLYEEVEDEVRLKTGVNVARNMKEAGVLHRLDVFGRHPVEPSRPE